MPTRSARRPVRPLAARPALRAAGALALCAATVAAAGCGTATIDTEQVESTITRQFAAQGIPLRDVSCDEGTKAEKGARVACTGRNPSDTTLVIEGSVTSVDGDKARFAAKAVRGVAKGPVIAQQTQRLLEQRVGQKAAGMTCPARVPIPTTPTVRCVLVTKEGPRYAATVRIDAQSRLQVELAQKALPEG